MLRKLAALALAAQALLGAAAQLAAAAPAPPPPKTPLAAPAAAPFFHNYSAISGLWANDTILNATRAAKELNAGFLNGGRGACWIDYDKDGDDDLYVVGPGRNQLFRNDGGWNFTEVTNGSGLDIKGYGMACGAADLNNDGFEDIWVTNFDSYQSIMRNNGDGTFSNMTSGSVANDLLAHTGVAFGDFDKDGLLDVFVTDYNRQQDRIYRNLGNFTFEERWNSSHMIDSDFGFQPLVYDFDLDGDVDIYSINDFGLDRMWRNDGNWTFTDVSGQTGANDPRGGMGGDVSDVTHDGDLDLYVSNYQENGLWMRNGSIFEDKAKAAGVDNASTSWAAVFFDYNNDGWEDLFVANGVVDSPSLYHQSNVLYENLGNLTFEDVSAGSGADSHEVSRSVAVSDVDGDGRVDLYVSNVNGPNEMLRNVYNSTNGWLSVRLEGVVSNADGVGALVRVKAGNQTLIKPMMAGAGYLSTHSKVMHFGLGGASVVDSVEVDWPSGVKQVVMSPGVNSTVVVRESDPVAPVAVAGDVSAQRGVPFALNGSASSDDVGIARYIWRVDVNGTVKTLEGAVAGMAIYTVGNFTGSLEVRDFFGNSNTTGFTVAVAPYDAAWVDGGPDFAVRENAAHTFAASGGSSVTPDFENTSTFLWTFTEGGTPVALSGPRPTYTFTKVGVWEVRVQVWDVANNTAQDFVNVTVEDGTAPRVAAVVPLVVDEDTPVGLDASATTDNDPAFPAGATFRWSYATAVGPVSFEGEAVTYAFPDPGSVHLILTVTDAAGNAGAQSFDVHVRDTTPPTADAGADLVTQPGAEVTLDASGSTDNARDFLENGTFTWRVHTRGGIVQYTGATRLVTFGEPGVFEVELMAVDPSGNAALAPGTMNVTVQDLVPPYPDAGGDRFVEVGRVLPLDASNSTDNDPDFQTTGVFTWEFQDGAVRQKLVGRAVDYTFAHAGAYRVRLSAVDAAGNSAAVLFTVTVGDSSPPVLGVAPLPAEVFAGDALVLDASGTADNVGVASVGWRVTGPFAFDERVFAANGSLVLEVPGTYNATVTARDAAGNTVSQSFAVKVVPRPPPSGGGNGTNTTPPGGGGGGTQGGGGGPGGAAQQAPALPPAAAVLAGAASGALGALALLRLRGRRRGGPPQAG